MIYEKATAEVILFDNSDVIRTSSAGGSCRTPGHDNGHGCGNTSGTCSGLEKRRKRIGRMACK